MRSVVEKSLKFCLLGLFFLTTSIVTYAQTSGTLSGLVVDNNLKPIANALVTAINENSGISRNTITNDLGRYRISFLEPGRYTVKATLDGYTENQQPNQIIPLNQVTTLEVPPIVLTPLSAATTTPTTTPQPQALSSRALVNLNDATARANYDLTLIRALPLSGIRTFDFFALLTPGVLPAPATNGTASGPGLGPGVGTSGQFSVNGRPARANNFAIDGSDNNDQDIGVRRQGFVALVPQSIESVNEFQISTHLWDTEFGRNIGAQVNAVSLSGGNDIHGIGYLFINDSSLNARNFFDIAGKENDFTRFQGGFVLGGPIVKNRTHYFASYEHQNIDSLQELHFAVPTFTQRFFNGAVGFVQKPGLAVLSNAPIPNNTGGPYGLNNFTQNLRADADANIFSFKLTHKIGTSLLTGRYNFTDDNSIIPSVGGAINGAIGTDTRTQNLSLFYDSSLSNTSFNQVRFSYGRTVLAFPQQSGSPLLFGQASPFDPARLAAELNQFPQIVRTDVFSAPVTTPFGTFGPFGRTGPIGQIQMVPFSPIGVDPFTFPQGRTNNVFQLADTFTKTIGAHSLKIGADFRRVQLNSFLDRNFRPQYVFAGGFFLNPGTGNLDVLFGNDTAGYGVASQIFQTLAITPDSSIGLRLNEYNFFVQDNWKVTPRLTLDYGLRYEFSSVPTEVNRKIERTFGLQFPADDPRVQLAQNPDTPPSAILGVIDSANASLSRFLDGRDKIYRSDANNFSPRIGLAFDLTGNKKTVLRAGYGLYYDQVIGSVTSQSRNVFPSFIPLVFDPDITFDLFGLNRVIVPPAAILDNSTFAQFGVNLNLIQSGTLNTLGFPPGFAKFGLGSLLAFLRNGLNRGGGAGAGGLAFILPEANFRTPYSQHWNVGVEHQFANDYVVSASYTASTGTKLIRFRNPNGGPNSFQFYTFDTNFSSIIPTRFGPLSRFKTEPNLGPFTIISSSASSNFHSLQLSLRKNMSKGLQFGTSYTYSHAIDEVSDVFDTAGAFNLPQNDQNLRLERASASFDVRHRSVSYFVYDLPFFASNRWLGGFQMAGVLTLQTGQPFTVNTASDANRDGNLTDRIKTSEVLQQVD
ncbi:MAG: TonB-dependent receptor, partial [Blastocatellia bacterium]|nr:TonB-dependent receptor [Blastocatellia bacterium]